MGRELLIPSSRSYFCEGMAKVRSPSGQKRTLRQLTIDVRFTPKTRHLRPTATWQLCARVGLPAGRARKCQQRP
jgi:hypothetical protein